MKLNESPDNFKINDKRVGYTRNDAISFIIFKGGYIVYSSAGVEVEDRHPVSAKKGHVALSEAWTIYNKVESMGEESLNDYEKSVWPEYKEHIKTYGEKTPEARKLANEFISGERSYWDYSATDKMIKGRLWKGKGEIRDYSDEKEDDEYETKEKQPKTDKVISFWNRMSEVKSVSDLIVKVIELVGENPKEYNYEIETGRFVSYYEFLGMPEDKTDYNKKYNVNGTILTYTDFETLRTTMHTGGPIKGPQAKEKLCRILTKEFVEKNPELRGFIPPDCGQVDSSYGYFKKKGWTDYVRPEAEQGLEPRQGTRADRQTVVKPGYSLGMKGRTLGGFRSKTQKEIDAAWDDFMKKREGVKPQNISFKEWLLFVEDSKKKLLNEDPNEVSKNLRTKRPKLMWSDYSAITFILFKDYAVYAPTAKGAMHDDIAHWLVFKVLGKEFLKNFERLNPWSKSIKQIGVMGKGATNTIKRVSDMIEWGMDGRNAFLRTNPEVILGRVWPDKKVISFWNHYPYVIKNSDVVLKFVSMFGDAKEFEYDVRNMEVSYNDILNKKMPPLNDVAVFNR